MRRPVLPSRCTGLLIRLHGNRASTVGSRESTARSFRNVELLYVGDGGTGGCTQAEVVRGSVLTFEHNMNPLRALNWTWTYMGAVPNSVRVACFSISHLHAATANASHVLARLIGSSRSYRAASTSQQGQMTRTEMEPRGGQPDDEISRPAHASFAHGRCLDD